MSLQGQNEGLKSAGAENATHAINPTIDGKYPSGDERFCGYFTDNNNGNMDEDNDPRNCGKLNFAKAHFQLGGSSGTGLKRAAAGNYAFVDTRNNNFSNRAQKMSIFVAPGADRSSGMSAAQIAGLVFGIGIPVACVAILALAALGAVLAVFLTGSTGAVLAFFKRDGGIVDGEAPAVVKGKQGGRPDWNAEVIPEEVKGKASAPPKPTRGGGHEKLTMQSQSRSSGI